MRIQGAAAGEEGYAPQGQPSELTSAEKNSVIVHRTQEHMTLDDRSPSAFHNKKWESESDPASAMRRTERDPEPSASRDPEPEVSGDQTEELQEKEKEKSEHNEEEDDDEEEERRTNEAAEELRRDTAAQNHQQMR
uniref:Uncharacterized protein n=1 Tax=Chromera velia CCMP2878 TaxID=1169474 RepID=A0A0G4HHA9_9ALVE|eukprot:Cvel_27560.t1-p1 / transcript=Cvel_27560.t1 / gene=Cvel_27560 / organism=Chromera_velia_CCMP2878 / gene_product=hypothetical protein / transcript_product=hypothetical protein / location=Cvel_scaffold3462:4032-4436(-) / protein_length=135 / sequence_SO=supercontig / SO=protein_coding / is_pseudo=false